VIEVGKAGARIDKGLRQFWVIKGFDENLFQ